MIDILPVYSTLRHIGNHTPPFGIWCSCSSYRSLRQYSSLRNRLHSLIIERGLVYLFIETIPRCQGPVAVAVVAVAATVTANDQQSLPVVMMDLQSTTSLDPKFERYVVMSFIIYYRPFVMRLALTHTAPPINIVSFNPFFIIHSISRATVGLMVMLHRWRIFFTWLFTKMTIVKLWNSRI